MRVDYLSRAHMCLSSCEMNTASNFADFMLHLEEKKEVAKVQLMVRIPSYDAWERDHKYPHILITSIIFSVTYIVFAIIILIFSVEHHLSSYVSPSLPN